MQYTDIPYVLVPLANGKGFAVVDAADEEAVVEHGPWFLLMKSNRKEKRYAQARPWINGKQCTIYLHRFLLDAEAGIHVDHIDGDGLNNRRSNIRLATPSQNTCNRTVWRSGQYKGVERKGNRWRACVTFEGRRHYLGSFASAEEAAMAYDRGARLYHGEFAVVNFPDRQ